MSGIFITLGGGRSLGVNEDDDLVIVQLAENRSDVAQTINLGRATESQFDRLIEYIKRMKIHAVKELP